MAQSLWRKLCRCLACSLRKLDVKSYKRAVLDVGMHTSVRFLHTAWTNLTLGSASAQRRQTLHSTCMTPPQSLLSQSASLVGLNTKVRTLRIRCSPTHEAPILPSSIVSTTAVIFPSLLDYPTIGPPWTIGDFVEYPIPLIVPLGPRQHTSHRVAQHQHHTALARHRHRPASHSIAQHSHSTAHRRPASHSDGISITQHCQASVSHMIAQHRHRLGSHEILRYRTVLHRLARHQHRAAFARHWHRTASPGIAPPSQHHTVPRGTTRHQAASAFSRHHLAAASASHSVARHQHRTGSHSIT